MVHETLADLSRLPAELVALIEGFCQGQYPRRSTHFDPARARHPHDACGAVLRTASWVCTR